MDDSVKSETSPVRVERFVIESQERPDSENERCDEGALRPRNFAEYPGQSRAKDNLKVYVEAAKRRRKPLDHVLLHGPPGLGKTTLARIIAFELGVPFYQTSGPSIERAGDLAGILAGLEADSVLFIDEIHRMSAVIEEVLYSAMEDFCMDIVVGQGPTARTLRMPILPFTLVGATTRVSLLTRPLLSRFGIQERLEFYDDEALSDILQRTATLQGISLKRCGAKTLAQRSRGTPRTANRLLRRVRDFAEVNGSGVVDNHYVAMALNSMEIDHLGLEPMDRALLRTLQDRYDGGPVGLETLSHTVGEDKSTIEDVYEPYLVHRGLLARGPRGRELTQLGKDHLNSLVTLAGRAQ